MANKFQTKRKGGGQISHGDPDLEWENHMILRVPGDCAERVRAFCNQATPSEKLHIKFNTELRSGILTVGNEKLHFTVYDLPCVVEVMKTLDNINVYKVADLAQVLNCSKSPVKEPDFTQQAGNTASMDPTKLESLIKQKREKFYQYPHGLAPPLKNARKKRFRKTKKKKYMDAPEVEKEVKRLLRADLEADSVKWEVITVEQNGDISTPSASQRDNGGDAKGLETDVEGTANSDGTKAQSSQEALLNDEDSQTAPSQVLPDDDDLDSDEDDLNTAMGGASLGPIMDEDTLDGPPQPINQDIMNDVFGELSSSSDDDE